MKIHPHWKTILNSHPHWEKHQNIWKSPLYIQAVNNRIWNAHPYNSSSPLAFSCHILSPLAERFSPGLWEGGVNMQLWSKFELNWIRTQGDMAILSFVTSLILLSVDFFNNLCDLMTSQNLKLPYLLVFLFNSAQILPRVAYLYKESENAKKSEVLMTSAFFLQNFVFG